MSPCRVSSILTVLTAGAGLGLLVPGLAAIVNLLIAGENGERLEMKPAG